MASAPRHGRRPWRLPSAHKAGWCRCRHRRRRARRWWPSGEGALDLTGRRRAWRSLATPPKRSRPPVRSPAGATVRRQSATPRRKLPSELRFRDEAAAAALAACGPRSPAGLPGSVALVPAPRRQEASKLGQACCEQSRPTGRMSSRSALARACGTLASTCGAKPGRTVSAAAINAAMATAERALIMTVPCHWAFGPSFRCRLDNHGRFRDVFATGGKWFRRTGVLFRRPCGDETCRLCQDRRADPVSGSASGQK